MKKVYLRPVLRSVHVALGVFGNYCDDGGDHDDGRHGGRHGGGHRWWWWWGH